MERRRDWPVVRHVRQEKHGEEHELREEVQRVVSHDPRRDELIGGCDAGRSFVLAEFRARVRDDVAGEDEEGADDDVDLGEHGERELVLGAARDEVSDGDVGDEEESRGIQRGDEWSRALFLGWRCDGLRGAGHREGGIGGGGSR